MQLSSRSVTPPTPPTPTSNAPVASHRSHRTGRIANALRLLVAAACLVVFQTSNAWAGDWNVVYTYSGNVTLTDRNGVVTTIPWTDANGNVIVNGEIGVGTSVSGSAHTNGTITATLTYIPTPGDPNDKPPAELWVTESASAVAGVEDYGGLPPGGPEDAYSLSASCSLSPAQSISQPFYKSKTGLHTVKHNSSSGSVTVSCNFDASASGTGDDPSTHDPSHPPKPPYHDIVFVQVGYSVGWGKNLMITSGRDVTYHREAGSNGTASKVPNFPDATGTTHADSVGNDGDSTLAWINSFDINYAGQTFGSWGSGSTYSWTWTNGHRVSPLPLSSGDISVFGIPWLPLTYTNPHQGLGGDQEHIHLTATDPNDDATLQADYYMTFHDAYEDVVQVSSITTPTDDPTSTNNLPLGWTQEASVPGAAPLSVSRTVTTERALEISVEIGQGSEAFSKMLALKFGGKSSDKTTVTATLSYGPVQVPTGERWTIIWAWIMQDANGTCSAWDVNGYVADGAWHLRQRTDGTRIAIVKEPMLPVP